MAALRLIGDELVLDGVALFRATDKLTPQMRMRLNDDGILSSDCRIRAPSDGVDAHDQRMLGRREGYESAVRNMAMGGA